MANARPPQLEACVAPLAARPQLWRTVAGTGLALACWFAALAALPLAGRLLPQAGGRAPLLLYLASFAALALGTAAAARLLQRRPPSTLFGPGGFRPRAFAAGIAVVAALGLLGGLAAPAAAPLVRQAQVLAWAAWLPLALPAILVQSAAEELLFRGYLQQGLAARFRSAWVWWLVPALMFGALHWNPVAFGPNAWLGVVATAVIGIVLGDVAARTGNLSAPIGLHFANNVMAMLVVAPPSPVSELALWLVAVDPDDAALVRLLLLADLAATLLAWAAWRVILRRRDARRLHSGGPGSI
jgi:membrane protease YdiL (CAAX protease family)